MNTLTWRVFWHHRGQRAIWRSRRSGRQLLKPLLLCLSHIHTYIHTYIIYKYIHTYMHAHHTSRYLGSGCHGYMRCGEWQVRTSQSLGDGHHIQLGPPAHHIHTYITLHYKHLNVHIYIHTYHWEGVLHSIISVRGPLRFDGSKNRNIGNAHTLLPKWEV